MFRGPKVLTLHSCFPDARWRHRVAAYYRWVFRRAAAVIAVSEATAQSMCRYADFQSTIIPNGIDVAYWRASPTPRYLRPGMRNLVYLGRLEERNGPDVAIEAFGKIAPMFPDVRLLMAGDGPMRNDLQAKVPPHLKGRVEFLGALYDERPELLASSSVFLLPARAVGFSIMVLEAFAAGLPVVALPALGTDRAGEHWSNVILAKDNQRHGLCRRCDGHTPERPGRSHRGRASHCRRLRLGEDRRQDPRCLPARRQAACPTGGHAPEGRRVAMGASPGCAARTSLPSVGNDGLRMSENRSWVN